MVESQRCRHGLFDIGYLEYDDIGTSISGQSEADKIVVEMEL